MLTARVRTIALCALAACVSPLAVAQGFDAHSLRLAPDASAGALSVSGASMAEHLSWEAGGTFGIAHRVLVQRDVRGDVALVPLENLFTLDLMGAIALWDRLSVGLVLPLHLANTGDDPPPDTDFVAIERGAGVGDLRLSPRVRIWSSGDPDGAGVHLGARVDVSLPTGDREHFRGGGFQLAPSALLEVRTERGLAALLNVGYLMRSQVYFPQADLEVDDAITWAAGLRAPASRAVTVLADVHGEVGYASATAGTEPHPIELLAGVDVRIEDVVISAGVGRGLSRGFGAPAFRALVGARYAPRPRD